MNGIPKQLLIFVVYFFVAWPSPSHSQIAERIEATETNSLEDSINSLNDQFWEYNRSNLQKALSIASRADSLAHISQNPELQAITSYNLSVIFQNLDIYDSALLYANKSIAIDSITGNVKHLSKSLSRLGSIFEGIDNYTRALQLYYQSLALKEDLNDTLGVGVEYHRLGNIYNDNKEYREAEKFYLQALKVFKLLNQRRNIATTYNNLGVNYYYLDDTAKANYYYSKALREYLLIGDQIGIATGYNNLGTLKEERGHLDSALYYYQKGLTLREEQNDKSGISNSLTNIGSVYLHQKKYKKAEAVQLKALSIAKDIGSLHLERNILDELISLYERQSSYEKAFKYQKEYQTISDSLFNEADTKRIIRIGLEYEFDKQEKLKNIQLKAERKAFEADLQKAKLLRRFLVLLLLGAILIILIYLRFSIAIRRSHKNLRLKNEEITKQKQHLESINSELLTTKEKLTETNAEKDRFFSIIAHDLKNPFNIMIGITSILASGEIKIQRDEEIRFLKDLHKVSTEGYKLLQNLLEWARHQRGENKFIPEPIDILQLIQESTKLLEYMASGKDIDLKVEVPNGTFAFGDKNMISTVIRNLISNALKFTPKKGTIIIGSEIKENFLHLYVKDNGVGIKKEDLNKLFKIDSGFSNPGTEKETGTGLGLILCKDFVEKNGGKIWVESKINEGSTFFFTIPLKP